MSQPVGCRALIASRSVKANRPAVAAGLKLLASGGDFADGVIAFERMAARLLSEAGESVLLL
jgi:hypothetical protein